MYLCSRLIDYHEIIECITGALDAKDPYTAGHSRRVSDMALRTCFFMDLGNDVTDKIHIASHLHDIGKIGIPDAILNKAGKLNELEWEAIKTHPQRGVDILSGSVHLAQMKDIILHHHERFDGSGYPAGLKGEKIPLGARVIAICDSIDAMTSNRIYRSAYSLEYCYMEIEKNLGKIYDPAIGRLVLDHWHDIVKNNSE
ncbi:MAG: HD-GYP domain-containing protein [Eubacteriales bacterium]|nr:HD-GYP domain-containing protein [Eubacteriales bacterium]